MIAANLSLSPAVHPTWVASKPFFITASLADAAERWPDRLCQVSKDSQLTYETAWIKVLRIATWLQQNGVGRGDKVLMAVGDRMEVSLIAMAVAHVGAVVSVLSSNLEVSDFAQIVAESEPICIFLDAETQSLKPATEGVLLTVWLDETAQAGDWDVPFAELMETSPAFGMRFPGTPQDAAFLVYPDQGSRHGKGLLLSHENIRHLMNRRSSLSGEESTAEDRSMRAWNQFTNSRSFPLLVQAA